MDADTICVCCDEPCEEAELNAEGECPECAKPTCESCGESFDADDLKGNPPKCEDCLISEGHCTSCNGTGEGQVDGARCTSCGGSGQVTPANLKDDFVEPDPDDDFDDRDYGPYGYSPD